MDRMTTGLSRNVPSIDSLLQYLQQVCTRFQIASLKKASAGSRPRPSGAKQAH